MKPSILVLLLTLALTGCSESVPENTTARAPNIVYILADDLGYGDLSAYGQTRFETPNIDRIAARGMLFTQHYSGATVCAPSRSALLTGYHTGHTYVRGNKEVRPEGQWPIPDSTLTLAEVLQSRGYVTGAFGKWGLGAPGSEGDPTNQGFDRFFGFNCQRLAHHYYFPYLWNNLDTFHLPGNEGAGRETYVPDVVHERALSFIDDHRDEPFFLYYPHIVPHAEMFAPEAYVERFRGQFLPEKSYEGLDAPDDREWWGFKQGAYGSQPEAHAAFAAMVTYLDDHVGDVLSHLDSLGLTDNTLVIFTSDNGPHQEAGADPDYFDSNGPLRGYKRDLYEGGIRVPMIASWPGHVKAGSRTDHVSAFWDVFPTVGAVAGATVPEGLDGISFLPTLTGRGQQNQHDFLYWEFHNKGGRQAIRKGDWKLLRYNVNGEPRGPYELYDLSRDLGEENDLAAERPEVVRELRVLLEGARTESEIFAFN